MKSAVLVGALCFLVGAAVTAQSDIIVAPDGPVQLGRNALVAVTNLNGYYPGVVPVRLAASFTLTAPWYPHVVGRFPAGPDFVLNPADPIFWPSLLGHPYFIGFQYVVVPYRKTSYAAILIPKLHQLLGMTFYVQGVALTGGLASFTTTLGRFTITR